MPRKRRWALLVLFYGGIVLTLWPAGQAVYGVWCQRELRAEWVRAQAQVDYLDDMYPDGTLAAPPVDGLGAPSIDEPGKSAEVSSPARETSDIHMAKALTYAKRSRAASGAKRRLPHLLKTHPVASEVADWVPTRLYIPRIGVDAIVVQGVGPEALRRGPGHDPMSALPGAPGNCIIAAHRNAYGWWFSELGALKPEDYAFVETPGHIYTYRINNVRVVQENETGYLKGSALPALTLYTCAMPHGSRRILVQGTFVEP